MEYSDVKKMNKDDSDDSFANVDEDIASGHITGSVKVKHGLSVLEELSAIPKCKDIQVIKSNNLELSRQLKSKIVGLKSYHSYFSVSDLEEFLNIENYIRAVEELDENNEPSTELCMDISYVVNIRKQHDLMVRLLSQIALLQREVDQGYLKIKEIEEQAQKASNFNKDCELEVTSFFKNNVCSCLII